MDISITLTDWPKPKPQDDQLGFGKHFTDHMFTMHYSPEKGWHSPNIEPYRPFAMDPASLVLHYGQAVFEGLKAYRTPDDHIQLFRPMDNMKRMNQSCRLLCIPEFDEFFVLDALKTLVQLEKDWVPRAPQASLYIRPTIYASDAFLGLRESITYRFFIILSPVGAYYTEGFNPIKIMVSGDHVRAVRGGTGEAKTPGNYAASLLAGKKAREQGYAQVLWLDGIERKYIEEVGAMNIFFVIDNTLVTPTLNGSILPGITRDTVLKLAMLSGIQVYQRNISINELFEAGENGRLQEVFGSGTAAVISPVSEIGYGDRVLKVGNGDVGPITQHFFKAITDIQYGKVKDKMGWIEMVDYQPETV